MKNEYKILIAALVLILIFLIGAFALSGSKGPQATVTPTAQPTNTPTPTPTPLASGTGGSSGGASNPTPTPTIAPTATPTPTVVPSPTPTSGVELTQFGYWITYPPLKPENWSTNPPPQNTNSNVVYFSPASQTVTIPIDESTSLVAEEIPQGQAVVHRDGNLSGTTNVLISLGQSDNMNFGDLDYSGEYYIPIGNEYGGVNANLTENDNGTYTLCFDPGVSEQNISIFLWGIYDDDSIADSSSAPLFSGTVSMTIIGVDSPFAIGTGNQYTLTVNSPTASPGSQGVQFISPGGYVGNKSYFDKSTMDTTSDPTYDGNNVPWWEANITLTRTSTTGSLSPTVEISSTHEIPSGKIYISQQPTFADGQSTATVQVTYTLSDGNPEDHSYAYLSIDSSPSYTIGSNNPFYLDTYFEW